MKFKDLIYDIIVEEVKNKKLFDALMNKWRETFPKLTNEQGEYIYKRHDAIKGQIKPNNPAVITFLRRYDGNFGNPKFELKDITDITKLNIKFLIEFLEEFGNFNLDIEDNENIDKENKEKEIASIFAREGKEPTNDKIEISKSFWYDTSNALINEDNFRIYEIMNQAQSIRMGYYYQQIHLKNYLERKNKGQYTNAPWCVTWREKYKEYENRDENGKGIGASLFEHGSNMYGTYRISHNRTFYFIIDESKDMFDKYYMSALQIDNVGNFKLTSLLNDGDFNKTWDEIVEIYPKLGQYRDLIKFRKMSQDEIETKSIIDVINENENSPNYFARQSSRRKEEYIDALGTLKKPESWESMPSTLKDKYIDVMTSADAYQRFSNFEFLKSVLNTPGIFKKLEDKLRRLGLGKGIGYIVDNIMKTEYKRYRTSANNVNRVIYTDKGSESKYGIFNNLKGYWDEYDGVQYTPEYRQGITDFIIDKNNNQYLLEEYQHNNKFYVLTPYDELDKELTGYFLSEKEWNNIKHKFIPIDEIDADKLENLEEFNPQTDIPKR